ncbi:DUF3108 domain-containing protein [Vibrio sp. SS-MA-C1-2]|uniref:DUF3108 domain-containing protein n=1 Tax=Vibrio sp. SS-MA-C1-2 TaxID=2908646 RepID=UPI001F1FCFA3|nr:DUF3108 domain-containing protein [Vibrio sp. SS-MA-C1-2]UJF18756.1 DUF3108 domain-containing protein [Vibrio sp. SS-MA-C1-2]
MKIKPVTLNFFSQYKSIFREMSLLPALFASIGLLFAPLIFASDSSPSPISKISTTQAENKRVKPSIPFPDNHRCKKTLNYHTYLAGVNIGELTRIIDWQEQQAHVDSAGKLSLLGVKAIFEQQTVLIWSPKFGAFVPSSSKQTLEGFKDRKMKTSFSDDGTKSRVILDGKPQEFDNEGMPLADINTVSTAIRYALLNDIKDIKLYRQGRNKIKPLHFQVQGLDKIKTKTWGEIPAYRVYEVGKYKKVQLWFSPDFDYQLVKARYDTVLNVTVELVKKHVEC